MFYRGLASRTKDTSHWLLQDYTHSTAPNRRFADLVTQRLIKSVLAKQPDALQRRPARFDGQQLHGERGRGS